MNSTSTNRVSVEPGGKGVVAHVGLHALGSLADALGLGSALTSCIEPSGERTLRHDRGKVLVQMALVLAGGHGVGDDVTPSRRVIARADNAGCTREFLAACRARRVNSSVTARQRPVAERHLLRFRAQGSLATLTHATRCAARGRRSL